MNKAVWHIAWSWRAARPMQVNAMAEAAFPLSMREKS